MFSCLILLSVKRLDSCFWITVRIVDATCPLTNLAPNQCVWMTEKRRREQRERGKLGFHRAVWRYFSSFSTKTASLTTWKFKKKEKVLKYSENELTVLQGEKVATWECETTETEKNQNEWWGLKTTWLKCYCSFSLLSVEKQTTQDMCGLRIAHKTNINAILNGSSNQTPHLHQECPPSLNSFLLRLWLKKGPPTAYLWESTPNMCTAVVDGNAQILNPWLIFVLYFSGNPAKEREPFANVFFLIIIH